MSVGLHWKLGVEGYLGHHKYESTSVGGKVQPCVGVLLQLHWISWHADKCKSFTNEISKVKNEAIQCHLWACGMKKRGLTPSYWATPGSAAVAAAAVAGRRLVAVARQPYFPAPTLAVWTSGAPWDLHLSAGTLRLRDGGRKKERKRKGDGGCFTSYNFLEHPY